MKLTSTDFENYADIPVEFTCQGKQVSPALSWKEAPSGTKSFALSVIDPDAPSGDFIHWLLYNIPKDTIGFSKGTYKGTQVMNDAGKLNYVGPCPPSGKHRYFFTIYALDIVDLGSGINKDNFREIVGEHTISKAEMVGLYKKN